MAAQVIDWNTAMTKKMHAARPAAKSCDQLSMELSAYFDGELEAPDRAAIELHVSECETCNQKLDQMRKLRHALTGLSAATPRKGSVLDLLRAELRGEAEADPTSKRRSS